METIPSFIDFEASSLGSASYPIEVAWNLSDGSIESCLISPAGTSRWTDWSYKAERIHGIARAQLLAEGRTPSWVCQRLNEQLAGQTVYSDAPDYDGMWLAELFSVCRGEVPGFQLDSVDRLLLDIISPHLSDRAAGLAKIEEFKAEARKRVSQQHRAAWDVQFLVELWRLANG
ncbi:MAG: hypothetical protein FIA97_15035 [Methylococcaceae bacterium]|nr:hypothetical protein [Methylococcaceae bacterium]